MALVPPPATAIMLKKKGIYVHPEEGITPTVIIEVAILHTPQFGYFIIPVMPFVAYPPLQFRRWYNYCVEY
jgi:hypothetical protein